MLCAVNYKQMKVNIEPYNEEMGTFWRVINVETNETVDDGFESTADAEMYCFDNELDYSA